MARRRRKEKTCAAHIAPARARPPSVREEVPALCRLEREVADEFRVAMCSRLQAKIAGLEASLAGCAPRCTCGRAMKARGRRATWFLTRFGKLRLRPAVYRCATCKRQSRPLLERLGVEVGRISGSLSRLVALLGVVVPYELAARLCRLFFGVDVSAMAVWRAVQRLGEACEQYTAEQALYLGDPNTELQWRRRERTQAGGPCPLAPGGHALVGGWSETSARTPSPSAQRSVGSA
jgi:hypothetical protein